MISLAEYYQEHTDDIDQIAKEITSMLMNGEEHITVAPRSLSSEEKLIKALSKYFDEAILSGTYKGEIGFGYVNDASLTGEIQWEHNIWYEKAAQRADFARFFNDQLMKKDPMQLVLHRKNNYLGEYYFFCFESHGKRYKEARKAIFETVDRSNNWRVSLFKYQIVEFLRR